ncbi:MAG: LysM peptidoglycan-binding domain-containing protein [Anaerolineae bacterium]|nr:LysM peptidoglycan-binding domain-containing protein [Anaerolineae bacterium]
MARRGIGAALIVVALILVGGAGQPSHAQSGGTVHIVQRSETLSAIARRYGVTVDAIAHANGIPDPRHIYVGQRLVIPTLTTDEPLTTTKPYIFQAGDTLASIARRYHTTWQRLARLNRILAPGVIYTGQVIQVPSSETEDAGLTYVVRPDDTLLRIALRYGVDPWHLMAANRVGNPALIYPGQALLIPGAGPSVLPVPFLSVDVRPLPVKQGEVIYIAVRTTEPVTLTGRLFEQEVRFAEENGIYYGLLGVHVFTEPGLYALELSATNGQGQETGLSTAVVVAAGRFYHERIDLPAGRANLLDPAAIARDRERLDAARAIFTTRRHWTIPFERPCPGSISAYFGSRRAYNGGPYTSYHSGIDFRVPGGTPVRAAAAGTVVLAEPLMLWGNAVVIDHGWGVLTGYAHLGKIEVEVGQHVEPGEVIAAVGNTGLSTGAHLHWEMWVGGISVNGLQWLEGHSPWPASEWLAVGG